MKNIFKNEVAKVVSLAVLASTAVLGSLVYLTTDGVDIRSSAVDVEQNYVVTESKLDSSQVYNKDDSKDDNKDDSKDDSQADSKDDSQDNIENKTGNISKKNSENTSKQSIKDVDTKKVDNNSDTNTKVDVKSETHTIDNYSGPAPTAEDPVEMTNTQGTNKDNSAGYRCGATLYAYDKAIYLSENDMMLMCTVVSSETGYCEDQAQKAVAHTILNRLISDNFPNTMYEVVTQENQYTAIHSYFDGQYRDGLYPGSELWNNTMRLCYEAVSEWDFTGGAVAYYNPEMIGYNAWFESLTLTYVDKYGRFFKI